MLKISLNIKLNHDTKSTIHNCIYNLRPKMCVQTAVSQSGNPPPI